MRTWEWAFIIGGTVGLVVTIIMDQMRVNRWLREHQEKGPKPPVK